jgi:flagellar hook-length control protein FliK
VSGEVVLEVPEPVDAVEVQVGLPSTQIGDRPSAAGNRIAALAEMGAQLASLSSAESSQFVHQFQHLHPHLRDILSGIAQAQNQPTLDERLGVDATVANQEMNTPGTAWTTLGMHSTRILIPDSATALSSPILSGKLVPEGGVAEQTLTAIQAHLHQLNKEGQAEFRLHLHPPELGPLRIHLSLREGEIHGQLYVSDDTLRRLLQDQIPELRQRLEALGLNPGQWDIATDSRGSQPDSAWSSGQQVETSPRWWNEPPNYKPVVTNTPEPPGSASADSLEPNRVDVMV